MDQPAPTRTAMLTSAAVSPDDRPHVHNATTRATQCSGVQFPIGGADGGRSTTTAERSA